MDPNATLQEIRDILSDHFQGGCELSDLHRLAELMEALDGWLAGGGFLPTQWDTHTRHKTAGLDFDINKG